MNEYERQRRSRRRWQLLEAGFTWILVIGIGLIAAGVLRLAALQFIGVC